MILFNNCGKTLDPNAFKDSTVEAMGRLQAVNQGNGMGVYLNKVYQYSLPYSLNLNLNEPTAEEIHFDNKALATDPSKVSFFDLKGFSPPTPVASTTDLLNMAKSIDSRGNWIFIQLNGAQGYLTEKITGSLLERHYFLLTDLGDVLEGTLKAYQEYSGIDFLAPIINGFELVGICKPADSKWAGQNHAFGTLDGQFGLIVTPKDNGVCMSRTSCELLVQKHLDDGFPVFSEHGRIRRGEPNHKRGVKFWPIWIYENGKQRKYPWSMKFCGDNPSNPKPYVSESEIRDYLKQSEAL